MRNLLFPRHFVQSRSLTSFGMTAFLVFQQPTNALSDAKHRKQNLFAPGLAVRLVGVAMLWLGDGSDSLLGKGLVVIGVVLSVGGIGVLRYLFFSGLRKRNR